MSGEQRDNNLGIDSNLRNTDPAEYHRQLSEKMRKLKEEMGLLGDDKKPNQGDVKQTDEIKQTDEM